VVRFVSLKANGLFSFGKDTTIRFNNTNIIVGPNNSGKTNILRLFRLVITSLLKPYDVTTDVVYAGNQDSCYIELKINLTEDEVDDLVKLILIRYSSVFPEPPIESFSQFINDLKNKIQTLTLRIEYEDEGTNRRLVKLVVFEENTGFSLIKLPTQSDIWIKIISNSEDTKTLGAPQQGFLSDVLYDRFKQAPSTFTFDGAVQWIKENKLNFVVSYPQNTTHIVEKKFVNKIKEKYSLRDDNQITFFEVLGNIIKSTIYVSESRSIKNIPISTKNPAPVLLDPDGSNLADYLDSMHHAEKQLKHDMYEAILQDFADVFESDNLSFRIVDDTINENGDNYTYHKIQIYDENLKFGLPIENTGAGIFESLYLLTVSRTVSDSVIFLDEPALHLHPNKINVLKQRLRENSKTSRNQLIIVTHSPAFLGSDLIVPDNNVIYSVRKNTITEIYQMGDKENHDWLVQNAEKLKFDFDPRLFFSRHVILVEGDSELGLLQGMAFRLNLVLDQNDVLLLPVDGKDGLSKFAKLLSMYNIAYSILADRDTLMDVSQDNLSRLLLVTKEIDPDGTKKLLNSLGTDLLVDNPKENRHFLYVKQKLQKKGDVETEKKIDELSKQYLDRPKQIKNEYFEKLKTYVISKDIFVINEGDLESLLKKVDPVLYDHVKSAYRSKRLRAREFVRQLDNANLASLDLVKKVLEKAIIQ